MKCRDEEMGPGRNHEVGIDDDEEGEGQYDYNYEDKDESDDASGESSDDYYPRSGGEYGSSYSNTWPQSYRQSIDMYSSVASPKVAEFIGGSSLTRLGHSFLRQPSPNASLTSRCASVAEQPGSGDGATSPLLPPSHLPVSRTASKCYSRRSSLSYHGLSHAPSGCSFSQAVVNGINVLCGVGMLSTPYAVKNGGWLGLLVLLGFGSISCYTGMLLKRCLDSAPGLRTYPDIGQAAFGTSGRFIIATILYMELYASCVEYIILVGDNLSALFPHAHLFIAGKSLPPHQLFAITAAITVLPTVWLRDLSLLSYLSAGGVISSSVVVLCLFWVGVFDGVELHPAGTVLDLTNLPVAIGLYGFCFAGHSVFPNIYSSLRKRSQFPAVLVASFLLCTTMYAAVASTGFLMFGESVKSQFTLNMPHQFIASRVAVWTTVVNPLTKYALTITPVALSLEELLPESQLQSHSTSVLIRSVLVLSTLLLALVLPFFGFVMALVGSFLTMLLALILPCLCYLSIERSSISLAQTVVCVLVTALGVTCSCVGSYTTIKKIVDHLD